MHPIKVYAPLTEAQGKFLNALTDSIPPTLDDPICDSSDDDNGNYPSEPMDVSN